MLPWMPKRRHHASSHDMRACAGFFILGFANTLLPAIIFACSYLIIPYHAHVVVLIQSCPALILKLILPHCIHALPTALRPPLLALAWLVAAVVTAATPPNVSPVPRVLMCGLASTAAAGADVCFMTSMRRRRVSSLAGWAAGCASGNAAAAVLPFVVTVYLGFFLRASVGLVYHLVGLALVAYYVILPWNPHCAADHGILGAKAVLARESSLTHYTTSHRFILSHRSTLAHRLRLSLRLVKSLACTHLIPLILASILLSSMTPGIGRANHITPAFSSFTAFKASHGLAAHAGNLVARAAVRIQKHRLVFTAMAACVFASLVAATAAAPVLSSLVTLSLAFTTGLAAGAVYINIFAKIVDQMGAEESAEADWSLCYMSATETGGILLGSLFGCLMETQLCSQSLGVARWCSLAR